MKKILRALVLAFSALATGVAGAADWPGKPLKFVVPFPPGGTTDLIARLLQDKLQKSLGQTVIVDNRPGAQGAIGTAMVAKAEPDGYTFVIVADSYATGPAITPNFPFDPMTDLVPVAPLGVSPQVLVVKADAKEKTLRELWSRAGARAGGLFFGTYSTGSLAHLAMLELASESKLSATHVPYKGGNPMVMATIAGEIPLGIGSVGLTSPQIKNGRLRPIGVMSKERFPGIDAPTLLEQGFAPVVGDSWWAMLAPSQTPVPVIEKMQQAIYQALDDPQVRRVYQEQGVALPEPVTSEEYRAFINSEVQRWAAVVKAQNVKAGG